MIFFPPNNCVSAPFCPTLPYHLPHRLATQLPKLSWQLQGAPAWRGAELCGTNVIKIYAVKVFPFFQKKQPVSK